MSLADLPEPPYYAVIFASTRADGDDAGYAATAARMMALAQGMPGFLGVDSVRDAQAAGQPGLTVSYWRDRASITAWREHPEHVLARSQGRRQWYHSWTLQVALVESVRSQSAPGSP